MCKNILVISVHPDDETIGCGGTILRHIDNNDNVYCLFVTSGNSFQKKSLKTLKEAYNFSEAFELDFPEIILDDISLSKIIPKISEVVNFVKPEIVYLPNRFDAQSDHRRVFEASMACMKTFRYDFIKRVLMMEVISETDFAPTLPENHFIPHVFVDISDYFRKKIDILKLFESEILDFPFTRSINSLTAYNRYRGSQINKEYAECFMLIKDIID